MPRSCTTRRRHPALLVRRFDRVPNADGTTTTRAQEDACQVLGRYPADKYSLTTEEVVAGLAAVTQAPLVAARDLVRQFAFAYLTGNGDAHAKNFSVLPTRNRRTARHTCVRSPELVPVRRHHAGLADRRQARRDASGVTISSPSESPSAFPRRATRRVLDHLVDGVDAWLPGIDDLPFDTRLRHKFRRAIEYRRQRLAGRAA